MLDVYGQFRATRRDLTEREADANALEALKAKVADFEARYESTGADRVIDRDGEVWFRDGYVWRWEPAATLFKTWEELQDEFGPVRRG